MSQGIDRNIQGSRFRRGRVMQACPDKSCAQKGGCNPGPDPSSTDWLGAFFPPWDFLSSFLILCLRCRHSFISLRLLDAGEPAAARVKGRSWWPKSADWFLSVAPRLSCSCRVDPVWSSCHVFGGSDRLVVSVSLSGPACAEQSATCLGFVCSVWVDVSLL